MTPDFHRTQTDARLPAGEIIAKLERDALWFHRILIVVGLALVATGWIIGTLRMIP